MYVFFKVYIIFFLINASSTGLVVLKNWKLSRDTNNVKVWQLVANPNVTGSIEKRDTEIDWSTIKKKESLEKFKNRRKKILSLIGVYDWKAYEHKWSFKKDFHQLNINGSYRDSFNKKITFSEVHIFKRNQIIQMLHTRPYHMKDGQKLSQDIMEHMKKNIWH